VGPAPILADEGRNLVEAFKTVARIDSCQNGRR
jgi:hypothetical protein